MAAKKNKSFQFPVKEFVIFSALAIGLTTTLYVASYNSNYRQEASNATDLNSSSSSLVTKNADGTMGPETTLGNFSTLLENKDKNGLTLKIGQLDRPQPTEVDKRGKGKSQDKGQTRSGREKRENEKEVKKDGIQSVTSLIITVNKAEVHLAQFLPPKNITRLPTGMAGQVPTKDNSTRGNPHKTVGADKWEMLQIDGERDFDLVELSKTNIADTLGLSLLACGKYTQIRLYVSKAKATLTDGTEVELVIPGKANIVKIVHPFTISPDAPTNITVQFDPQRSVHKIGNMYILKPVVARIVTN